MREDNKVGSQISSRLLMNQNKLGKLNTSKKYQGEPSFFIPRHLCKEITQRPKVKFLICIANWSAVVIFSTASGSRSTIVAIFAY